MEAQTERREQKEEEKEKAETEKKVEPEARCAVCNEKSGARCSRCKAVYYCSLEHQKEDYKEHRLVCSEKAAVEKGAETGGEETRDESGENEESAAGFLETEMFLSYYDGAALVFELCGKFRMGHPKGQELFDEFVKEKFDWLNGAALAASETEAETQTRKRSQALAALEKQVEAHRFTEEQLQHVEEVIVPYREQLREKPLGYVCGYAHAALEVCYFLMSKKMRQYATQEGAAAIATCSLALQAVWERISIK